MTDIEFDFASDISLSIATNAYRGISFYSEKRGADAIADYVSTLESDFESLKQLADTPEKLEQLRSEFARYREGYKRRTIDWLMAKSRCMSAMITGPANFPTARNQKANETERNRCTELIEFRSRALAAIRKKMRPEERPIMSGDADAVERLQKELNEAVSNQERMKAENKEYRARLKAKQPVDGLKYHQEFTLRNLNARIRRMKGRLKYLERCKATENTEIVNEETGIRVEDSPADNRIRLFFPGKPEASIRSNLKSNGFRWAPSIGCWQAYRNTKSLVFARQFTK